MTKSRMTRREAGANAAAATAVLALGGTATATLSAHANRGVALVTGCSSGFGRLSAIALARSGFTTFASMRRSRGRNAEAAAELRALAEKENLPLRVVDIDVTETRSVTRGIAAAVEAGPLAVVVNNAGISIPGAIELHTENEVRRQFETNLLGYHRVARAALPIMRRQGSGLLVQVSSGLGRIVYPTQGWYVATKFALEGMSEALAYEMAPFNVDVSIIQPTQFATRFLTNARENFEEMLSEAGQDRFAAYEHQIGMARFGLQNEAGPDPQMVADAIVELALQPQGRRPLRRIVSPQPQGLERINSGLAVAQDAVFEGTPFAEWRARMTD